jgi:hypothetical protein
MFLEKNRMNRQDVCLLINSTPKYFYMLPLQLTLLRRYAPMVKWPVYFATEHPTDPISQQLEKEFDVKLLPLPNEKAGFLESRHAALSLLPPDVKYVLPLQEDFLLDRTPMVDALLEALYILDTDRHISSIRLMPCPGPRITDPEYVKEKPWKILTANDPYIFTYQATVWRRMDLTIYFNTLLQTMEKNFGNRPDHEKKHLALTSNLGESLYGQNVLKQCLPDTYHLAWPRAHENPNAVYLCPWPYRPTAVTRGRLEAFAEELFRREGVKFERPQGNMLE